MSTTLAFDVEYYNKQHETDLKKTSVAKELEAAVTNGMAVDEEEYKVYTLFREQKSQAGFRNYADLKAKLPSRLTAYEDYFDLSSGTVRSQFIDENHLDNTQTEASGVGAALSLVSDLYGLTEADWEKIPKSQTKDLDFEIASTGTEFVELEAKGTVEDSRTVTPGISGHKKSIEDKKTEQRTKQGNSNTLIGVISTFPHKSGQNTLCRLLDPPVEMPTEDPLKHKLLARLSFYWREMRVVTSSRIVVALANRIQSLSLSRDYTVFDSVPPLDLTGEPFRDPGLIFGTRSVVGDNVAFGEVVPLGDGQFYFYGFDSAIIKMLVQQSHADIVRFRSRLAGTGITAQIVARVAAEDMGKTSRGKENARPVENTDRFEIVSEGSFVGTQAGRVLGIVRL